MQSNEENKIKKLFIAATSRIFKWITQLFKVQIPYLYKPNIACKLKEKKPKLYASLSGAISCSPTVLLPLNECNTSQLWIQNNLFKRA